MAEPSLDFFYELASPYACLSALRIRALGQEREVSIRWRPFLLGPIFQAEGMKDSPLNVFPLRGNYARRDVARRGRRYGFDVRFPSTFPRHAVLASRVALVALSEGWGEDQFNRIGAIAIDPPNPRRDHQWQASMRDASPS